LKARVHITLKNGVLDPQGKAVESALHGLGFGGVSGVRQGKFIELDVKSADRAAAKKEVEDMCGRFSPTRSSRIMPSRWSTRARPGKVETGFPNRTHSNLLMKDR